MDSCAEFKHRDNDYVFECEGINFNDFFDADLFRSNEGQQYVTDYTDSINSEWLENLFNEPILTEKFGFGEETPQNIQAEHSYSLALETFSKSSSSSSRSGSPHLDITDEESDNCDFKDISSKYTSEKLKTGDHFIVVKTEKNVLKDQPEQEDSNSHSINSSSLAKFNVSTLHIKLEKAGSPEEKFSNNRIQLPPTPPSSNTSDTEGSQPPTSPILFLPINSCSNENPKIVAQPVITTHLNQKLLHTGQLILSEEERRTLIQEGYPVPYKLPLTKTEEKALKKVRRKIKNKISAQESRRKKKEYVDCLEKKVENYSQENLELRKRLDSLENNNRSLLLQLQKLQAVAHRLSQPIKSTSAQTSSCLMILVLCFALFLGTWTPTLLTRDQKFKIESSPAFQYGICFKSSSDAYKLRSELEIPNSYIESKGYSSRTLLSYKDLQSKFSSENTLLKPMETISFNSTTTFEYSLYDKFIAPALINDMENVTLVDLNNFVYI